MSGIKNIKTKVSCADVLQLHGINWPGYGNIRCPMSNHEDNNPSCSIYADGKRWNCFGCNSGGDIIDLECALSSCEVRQAISNLSKLVDEEYDVPNMGENAFLPEIDYIPNVQYIILTEDVMSAWKLAGHGFAATYCNDDFCMWQDQYSCLFRGRRVYLIAAGHRDASIGRANYAARYLMDIAKEVHIIPISDGVKSNGCLLDWLDIGHSITELKGMLEASRPLTEMPPDPHKRDGITEQETHEPSLHVERGDLL